MSGNWHAPMDCVSFCVRLYCVVGEHSSGDCVLLSACARLVSATECRASPCVCVLGGQRAWIYLTYWYPRSSASPSNARRLDRALLPTCTIGLPTCTIVMTDNITFNKKLLCEPYDGTRSTRYLKFRRDIKNGASAKFLDSDDYSVWSAMIDMDLGPAGEWSRSTSTTWPATSRVRPSTPTTSQASS